MGGVRPKIFYEHFFFINEYVAWYDKQWHLISCKTIDIVLDKGERVLIKTKCFDIHVHCM